MKWSLVLCIYVHIDIHRNITKRLRVIASNSTKLLLNKAMGLIALVNI